MGLTVNKNSPSIKKIKTMKPNKSGRSPWTFEYSRKKNNPQYVKSALQRKAYRKARRIKVHDREHVQDFTSVTVTTTSTPEKKKNSRASEDIPTGTWECVKDQWEQRHEEQDTSIVVKFGSDILCLNNTYFYNEGTEECLVKCIDGTYYVFPCDIALDEPCILLSDEGWVRYSIGILETVHIPSEPQTQTITGWFKENTYNVTTHEDEYYMSDYEMNDDDRAQYYD